MAIKKYTVEIDYLTTPGETIKETLESLNMTQEQLAIKMGLSRKTISGLINGNVRITPKMAEQLSFIFDVPAHFWSALQIQYDEQQEKKRREEELASQEQFVKNFPYSDMANKGFVPKTRDSREKLTNLLKFFRVPDFYSLENQMKKDPLLTGTWRISADKYDIDKYALHSWIQEGTLLSEHIHTEPFDHEKAIKSLKDIRKLVLNADSTDFIDSLRDILASVGIALVLVPEITGSHVSGLTRWQSPFPKAIIELSLRYKAHDNFWFTFYHELAHVLLHNKKPFYTIDSNYGESKEELEANDWATKQLIPAKEWQAFERRGTFNKRDIVEFATSVNTHPDIVLGRLQKKKLVPYNYFSDLRVRYRWR